MENIESRIFEICRTPHIYMIINMINGKSYIGQHCGSQSSHYYGSGTIIKNAVNKYGRENFSKIVLESWEKVPNNIDDIEMNYIFLYETYKPNGYNISLATGCNIHKYGKTPWNKGKKITCETYLYNLSQAHINSDYVATEEHKKKLSESLIGYKRTNEELLKRRLTRSVPVQQIDLKTGEIVGEFNGSSFAAEYLIESGITNKKLDTVKRAIRSSCQGIYKNGAYGYHWIYKNQ